MNQKALLFPKYLVFLLSFLICLGDFTLYPIMNKETPLKKAISKFQNGDYDTSVSILDDMLQNNDTVKNDTKARVYFLLGACYEKLNQKKNAKVYFTKLLSMFEKKEISGFPSIGGIEPNSISSYKKVFKNYYKKKERERERASRNVIAKQASKSKKKKKGALWVAVAGGVAAVVVLLLLVTKKKKGESEFPKFEYKPVEWIQIPAGEFLMGDNIGDGQADQNPVHNVYLDEYFISRFEVTATQYLYYLQETGKNREGKAIGNGQFPVVNITWEEANDFCEWLSQKTGENINLPTEAQWEKAARGTDQRIYPWGNSEPNCQLGNFSDCGGQAKVVGTTPDGRSPYGVEDMAGNVSEWCRDWYDPGYYSISPYSNPQGPDYGQTRVVRGSNYFYSLSSGSVLHSSHRWNFESAQISVRLGFRVVKE